MEYWNTFGEGEKVSLPSDDNTLLLICAIGYQSIFNVNILKHNKIQIALKSFWLVINYTIRAEEYCFFTKETVLITVNGTDKV